MSSQKKNHNTQKEIKNPIIKTLQWLGVAAVSILLIIYFLVVDTRGAQKTPTIGSVNGKPIYYSSTSVYGRAFKDIQNYYQSLGIQINDQIYSFIEENAFRRAALTILLNDIASKNIVVSDKFLVDAMKSQFVDTNGNFDNNAYNNFLKRASNSEKIKIERELREGILTQTLTSEIFNNIKISSIDLEKELVKNLTTREIEVLYINAANLIRNNQVLDIDLEKYFTDKKTNFTQADISYITVETSAVADNLYKNIKDDTSNFDKYALEKSINTNNYKLGYVTKYEMPSLKIAEKVFSSKNTNTLLEPISDNGLYYIVLVNNIKLPEKYTDVNIDILKNQYYSDNYNNLIELEKNKQADILKKAVAENNNFISLNNNNNIEYYKSSMPFTYGQGNISSTDGNAIPESSTDLFNKVAFSVATGNTSDVIKLDQGVAVIKVISEERPDTTRLATINDITRENLKQDLNYKIINNIVIEWENKSLQKAKIKKNKL